MPAPPSRTSLFNAISKATANTKFGELYDYIVALLGASGNAADARTALGATTLGDALFTAVNAAAARKTVGVPNSGPLSGLRNLIINGDFSVNQRSAVSGAAVGAANTYTLDRWRVVVSMQSVSWTASGAGNLVTAPAGGFEQVIEGAAIAGGTYTINWSGTATCTVAGVARTKGATFTLTAGTNTTVRFSSGTVGEVQVEPGEVITGFEKRPPGLERALCQRYYETGRFYAGGYAPGSVAYRAGTSTFQVTKRVVPTVAFSNVVYGSCSGLNLELVTQNMIGCFVVGIAGNGFNLDFDWTASAEL